MAVVELSSKEVLSLFCFQINTHEQINSTQHWIKCTHLLVASVIEGQVSGALAVVCPSAVDACHLLPVA